MNDKKILARLVPDPAARLGCYLDPVTDIVHNLGADFKLPSAPSSKPAPSEDLTHAKVLLVGSDGPVRGIVTDMGGEDDDYFCIVQTESNEEVKIAAKSDMKPLSAAQIKKWDEEIAAAKA